MLYTLAGGVMDGEYILVTKLLLTSNAADWLVMVRDLLGARKQFAAQGAARTDGVRGLALGEHLQLGVCVLEMAIPGLRARCVFVPGETGEVLGPGQVCDLRQDGLTLQLGVRLDGGLH